MCHSSGNHPSLRRFDLTRIEPFDFGSDEVGGEVPCNGPERRPRDDGTFPHLPMAVANESEMGGHGSKALPSRKGRGFDDNAVQGTPSLDVRDRPFGRFEQNRLRTARIWAQCTKSSFHCRTHERALPHPSRLQQQQTRGRSKPALWTMVRSPGSHCMLVRRGAIHPSSHEERRVGSTARVPPSPK